MWIASKEESSFQRGWSIPNSSNISENLWRFSASSILKGEVPKILIDWSYNFIAKLFGIWPPVEIIVPLGCSKSKISITRSKDNSSKYKRSDSS